MSIDNPPRKQSQPAQSGPSAAPDIHVAVPAARREGGSADRSSVRALKPIGELADTSMWIRSLSYSLERSW